jgi:hypothetical protein
MMGLFGSSIDDPKTLGILQLASGLMSSPRFGQGMSQGLLAYGDTMQRAKQQQAQEKMNALREEQARMQMDAQRRAAEQEERDNTLMRQPFTQMPGPTQDQGPLMPRFDAGHLLGQGMSPAAAMQALNLHTAMSPEKQKPTILSEGQTAFVDGKPVFGNPKQKKPEKEPENIRVLKMIYGEGTPAYVRAVQQLGNKMTTHQPPTAHISLGSPTLAQMPDGTLGFIQPANRPGEPGQILKDPKTGQPLRPPPQNRDTKLPAELQRMQIAGDTMETLLTQYGEMLKKHNPRDPMTQMNPGVRADMQSLKRNLELQFKELQALGALAGPDIEIMRQALSDPFTFQGAYFGRDGLLSQVSRAKDLVKIRKKAVNDSQGKPPAPDAPAAPVSTPDDPLGLRGK